MIRTGIVAWGDMPAFLCDWVTWNAAYKLGYREPRFPVPAIHCSKVVWFPEGNPFREYGAYINLLGYNGRQGKYGPGYYTVHSWKWNTVASEW